MGEIKTLADKVWREGPAPRSGLVRQVTDLIDTKVDAAYKSGDDPFFTTVEVGHATDTTLARAAAGEVSVEGSRVYQRSNILGTVSQAAGVPTGAVIERGSNANGEYVRWADGTQICTFSATFDLTTTAAGNIFRDATNITAWTFPAVFIAQPTVVLSPRSTTVWGTVGAVSTTAASNLTAFTYAALSGVSVQFFYQAVGRWF